MKKLLILTGVACLLAFSNIQAQDYKTGLGVRLNYWGGGGLNVKHFMGSNTALEGILTIAGNGRGWNLTGLYEVEAGLGGVDGLAWFFGGGGHIGQWYQGYYVWDNRKSYAYPATFTAIGIDGILGIEYTIPSAPINFQLDWKPAVNIIPTVDWWHNNTFALSIRFAIK